MMGNTSQEAWPLQEEQLYEKEKKKVKKKASIALEHGTS